MTDLGSVIAIRENENIDFGRKAFQLRKFLTKWQEDFSQLERVIILRLKIHFVSSTF